ncbi:MAG: hypothetical protein GF317_19185 [Candidatus Lokiarchaeota archaeon]|nr:hypothetical protein [Candidatus Lokiarchaeota archaeon]MBD3201634.1 hypothetical protein [Candidatus Lokiarchaeota archaeon]
MARPRCENCGRKIRLISRPWIQDDDVFGDFPSHCPHCGSELSTTELHALEKHTNLLCLLRCVIPIVFMIILFIIVLNVI